MRSIEDEGAEAVVPDLYGFLLYCAYNSLFRRKKLAGTRISALGSKAAIAALDGLQASGAASPLGQPALRGAALHRGARRERRRASSSWATARGKDGSSPRR